MARPGLARRTFLRLLGGAPMSEVTSARDTAVRARAALAERDRRIASGVPLTFGQFQYENQSNLVGSKKWDTLDKMTVDPHIKGGLNEKAFALWGAEWEIQPASDEARDVEIAEFCSANLLRTTSDKYGSEYWCQTSWRQRLYEILGMLEHGFAMFHKAMRVAKGPGGTRVVFDRIHWLEPSSVDPLGWELDESDNLKGVYRTYTEPGSHYRSGTYRYDEWLPADEIALYPWELRGARFEGRPFIRPLYGPWFRKDFMLRMATIWAQKVGAPVPVGSYPIDWPDDVRDRFEEFIQSLRGTAPAEAYGMFPKDDTGNTAEVGFAGADVGEVDRMRGLIDGENLELAHGSARKSQMLGETSSGSRALGETQSRTDVVAMQAIAGWIEELETHGAGNLDGLVETLVKTNFAGVRRFPRLVCSKIDPHEGLLTMPDLLAAVEKGIVPKHPDIMRQVTERLGYSLPDDVYDELAEEQRAAKERMASVAESADAEDDTDADGDAGIGENDTEDDAAMALAAKDEFRKRIASLLQPMEGSPARGTFRRPNRLETDYVMLAEVQETFRVGEQQILQSLRGIRRDITSTLMGWLRSGKVTPRNLESLRQSKYRGMKKAKRSLRPVLDEVGQAGIAHVEGEIERMRRAR